MTALPTTLPQPKGETFTQRDAILQWLKEGNTITPLLALQKFGCFRLGARIWELKHEHHHDIRMELKEVGDGKHVAEYWLALPEEQPPLFPEISAKEAANA